MAGPNTLYITYLEKYGNFLKVWGQTDRNYPIIIEQSLKQMTTQFDSGLLLPTLDTLKCGALCCAKYKDGNYYRALITNVFMLHQSVVEVHFIDYGNRDLVPIGNLRNIGNISPGFVTIPPQARDFILANVTHRGSTWDNETILLITSEIRYMELPWVMVDHVNNHTFIKLYNKNGEDIAMNFFNRGLILSVASTTQHMVIQSLASATNTGNGFPKVLLPQPPQPPKTPSPISNLPSQGSEMFRSMATTPLNTTNAHFGNFTSTPVEPTTFTNAPPTPGRSTPSTPPAVQLPSPTILTYKTISLKPGMDYHVYISYVSDGPCQFSVQLQQMEETLACLMKDLNRMTLQPLEADPIPGTVCVARCIEDEHICRAVVTSMVDSNYKVFYVDFGNTEIVPLDNLYQIPFKYVIPKIMAMRYSLVGVDRSSVTLEMKCAFKEFVSDKLLRLHALAPPARSALPLCTLHDEANVNVLDVLRNAALLAYPEVIQLNRGFSQEVRVSYVHSCNHFYVQVKAKEEELRKVMMELQMRCPQGNSVQAAQIRVGLPCCALFESDGQWYRAQVLSKENDTVNVRYVDYGNEAVVGINNLRIPSGEPLTTLRPQALECCLNGYQNMEDDIDRDSVLEELILEKELTMKVIEMQGNRVLVDLIDNSRYNVGSLLLDRLASLKSQVSPLLIQDSHQIEQRKRVTPTQPKVDRKFDRDQNTADDTQDSWRNTRPPRKDNFLERNDRDNFDRGKGKRDGFKKEYAENGTDSYSKSNTNQREGSEKSWSDGSEKNWRKGSRPTNNQFNDKGGKNFNDFKEKPPRNYDSNNTRSFNRPKDSDSWDKKTNDNSAPKVMDPAPSTATFSVPDLVGHSEKVLISWFHDPAHFFCQLEAQQSEFRKAMEDIQSHYCKITSESGSVGAPVVALFPDDGVIYRARILEIKGSQYHVQFIDFGNVSMTNKVWRIETKFMRLPAQAICCKLNGLVPLDDTTWPNPDLLSSYFDKEHFTCNFISKENNNYSVELTSDDVNVNEALVSNGLAKYSGDNYAQEALDLTILLEQQIKVMLVEVESLASFYVQLQNGMQLHCTAHNRTIATETFGDTLKQCLGQLLIIYVDNVLEESVEVTLYDLSGTKLKILEPDEGAFETVEALCPYPICFPTISGWISYFTPVAGDKFKISIQPEDSATTLPELLESLFNHYDGAEEEPLQPETDLICAVHSSDTNWYRAQITKIEGDLVTVTFLDYGNSETVSPTELRKLDPKFFDPHILALEVLSASADETYIEANITATVWYGEAGWEAEIQKVDQAAPEIKSEEVPTQDDVQETPVQIDTEVVDPPQTTSTRVTVILSHTDSPNEFYVQLSDDLQNIDALQLDLQEQVQSFANLDNPVTGVLCAAPYSVDQAWYRAQVLDADDDIVTVRFVDYGNTDVLTNETTLKTLPADLLSLEQHARRCSLIIKTADEEWSAAALQRFEALTTDVLTVEIVHQDEKTTYLELYSGEVNVGDTLINEGLATKLELETDTSCKGYVSNLNSPSEFWIQLENSVADLEWISEQLSAAENFTELEDLTPGSLCAALFPEDEMWYRARILSNTVAGLEVLFIDYGNSCTCSGLRQLPEDLIMLPALAQKCSLQKPTGILQWPAQAIEDFKNAAADGATIFNIVKFSTGETSVVALLLNDEDISLKLLPQTQDALVSCFESISSFWIQKVDDKAQLKSLNDVFADVTEWPKLELEEYSNNVGVGFWAKEQKWCRVKVQSKTEDGYEVQFIDFGNVDVVTDVRKAVVDDVETILPMATQCKLEPLPGLRFSEESSTKFLDIINGGSTICQVEFVTAACDVVRLYLNGNDIRSDLEATCVVSSVHNSPLKSANTKNNVINPQLTQENIDNVGQLIFDFNPIATIVEQIVSNVEKQSVEANNAEETVSESFLDETCGKRESVDVPNDNGNELMTISSPTKYAELRIPQLEEQKTLELVTTDDKNEETDVLVEEDVLNTSDTSNVNSNNNINDVAYTEPSEEIFECSDKTALSESETLDSEITKEVGEVSDNTTGFETNVNGSPKQSTCDEMIDDFLDNEIDDLETSFKELSNPDRPFEEILDVAKIEASDNVSPRKSTCDEVLDDEIHYLETSDTESPRKSTLDQTIEEIHDSKIIETETNYNRSPKTSNDELIDEVLDDEIHNLETSDNESSKKSTLDQTIEEIHDSEIIVTDTKLTNDELVDEVLDNEIQNLILSESGSPKKSTTDETSEDIQDSTIEPCENRSPVKSTHDETLEILDNEVAYLETDENELSEYLTPDQTIEELQDNTIVEAETSGSDSPKKLAPDEIIDEVLDHEIEQLEMSKSPKKSIEGAQDNRIVKIDSPEKSTHDESICTVGDLRKCVEADDEIMDSSITSTQRRSSTPHCDKIVPGAISRGDLTEVLCNTKQQEAVEKCTDDEEKCIMDLSKEIGSAKSQDTRKETEIEINTSTQTFCKVDVDEKIVPGAIARGDLTEVSSDVNSKETVNGSDFVK